MYVCEGHLTVYVCEGHLTFVCVRACRLQSWAALPVRRLSRLSGQSWGRPRWHACAALAPESWIPWTLDPGPWIPWTLGP